MTESIETNEGADPVAELQELHTALADLETSWEKLAQKAGTAGDQVSFNLYKQLSGNLLPILQDFVINIASTTADLYEQVGENADGGGLSPELLGQLGAFLNAVLLLKSPVTSEQLNPLQMMAQELLKELSEEVEGFAELSASVTQEAAVAREGE
jgi:hypothetical protein